MAESALSAPDWRRDSGPEGQGHRRPPRRGARALFAILALWGLGGCDSGPAADPRPPNLVLLIGDDHGYPDFGFMGSERAQTPSLDRLAREGVVFPTGYSTSSLCRPALRTLLTGLEPIQYERFERDRQRESGATLPPPELVERLETLPRLLRERGYTSFQAGKYFEGSHAAAGFDAGMVEDGGAAGMRAASRLVRETLDPVLEFVDANAERPFFLWFAPKVPHLPHDPPARFFERYADAGLTPLELGYFASISWFDEAVGRLLDHLEEAGLRERTLVVYLADNGWDPRPAEGPDHYVLGGPRGKKSLYELGFRTPVLVHWPGRISPARHPEALVSIADLFPTLLEAAGARTPAGRIGRSLWPRLEGRPETLRTELVGWTHAIRNAPGPRITGGHFWRTDRWHFLQPHGLPVELYDVQSDPQETRNRAPEEPAVVAEATRAIRDWTARLPSVAGRRP